MHILILILHSISRDSLKLIFNWLYDWQTEITIDVILKIYLEVVSI